MRKTIDEIEAELSNTPHTTSFRALSLEEQSSVCGKRSQFARKIVDFLLSKRFFLPPNKCL